MNNLETNIQNYLSFCKNQKHLDCKTLKAYRIDLEQFSKILDCDHVFGIALPLLENYVSYLHQHYKPKSVKRKIASVKAFFHYLEIKDIITGNPFNKMQLHFREPSTLPKTIPLNTIELFLSTMYQQHTLAKSKHQEKCSLRDIAVIETLFATGIRVSELCTLKPNDVNLDNETILIYGKGKKERKLQICSKEITKLLKTYQSVFYNEIEQCNHFFVTPHGTPISDQLVRRMIKKYCVIGNISLHITPHMFRHTFATSLLEADVDIRYIQEMLGHSSINVTQIYTHVAMSKQKEILESKHPRHGFHI